MFFNQVFSLSSDERCDEMVFGERLGVASCTAAHVSERGSGAFAVGQQSSQQ